MISQRFGRLVVTQSAGANAQRRLMWWCLCDCGKRTKVSGTKLRTGATQSCGCYRDDCASARATTHGLSNTLTYSSWTAMMHRCYTETRRDFRWYGAKGIRVCKRWHKYENFLQDMGERKSAADTLERKSNNKNYTPVNCVWTTRFMQAQNRSNAIIIRYKGKAQSLSVWARELSIPYTTLHYRYRCGWSTKQIFSKKETDDES